MLKIRRPLGRLIFNMGIAIPGKTVFLIETAPWMLSILWPKNFINLSFHRTYCMPGFMCKWLNHISLWPSLYLFAEKCIQQHFPLQSQVNFNNSHAPVCLAFRGKKMIYTSPMILNAKHSIDTIHLLFFKDVSITKHLCVPMPLRNKPTYGRLGSFVMGRSHWVH